MPGPKRNKIAVIGAGNVGATTTLDIAKLQLGDIVLFDVVEDMPQGKALDMYEAAPVHGYDCRITGTNKYEDLEDSDLVVITAGFPRQPGMSRMDLLKKNAQIARSVGENLANVAPNAILIVVTNPLDVMTHLIQKVTGFPPERVMGMAGVLDSTRFRCFIADKLGCSVKDVDAFVLGGHGDSMVPLARYTTVSGIAISELLPKDEIDALIERTRKGGGEIVSLLKKGSAYYAPAASVTVMAASILRDEKRVLPACARVDGQYGLSEVYVGVPVKLGRSGVEEVIEVELTAEELASLKKSADEVIEGIEALEAEGSAE